MIQIHKQKKSWLFSKEEGNATIWVYSRWNMSYSDCENKLCVYTTLHIVVHNKTATTVTEFRVIIELV